MMKKTSIKAAILALASVTLVNCSPADNSQAKADSAKAVKTVVKKIEPKTTVKKTSKALVPLEDQYPVYTANYYKDDKLVNKYIDQLVAIEGTVLDLKSGVDQRPIYQLQLSGDVNKTLWVGSLVKVIGTSVKKGQTLRVLGFFDQTQKASEQLAKLTKDDVYLIGFCFHNQHSGLPIYLNKWMKHCIAWQNNQTVENLRK